MNNKINILITCVGGTMMPQLLKELKIKSKYNLNIIGTDIKKEAIGKYFCDYFEILPNGKNKNYIQKILEVIQKYDVKLIIPASDEEAMILSKEKEKLKKKNCILASDNFQNIKILNNKIKTYQFLEKNNINKIFWKKIVSLESLENIIENYLQRYNSFVLKSSTERGSREIFLINKQKEFFFLNTNNKMSFKEFKEVFVKKLNSNSFMIMEKLQKPVYDVDILTWKGELLKCITRKRLHSNFPNRGHKIIENSSITNLCEKIVRSINLSWLYDCDIMFDTYNNPKLLEINPRQSGSLAISLLAGINLIDDVIDLSLNKKIKKEQHKKNNLYIPYQSLIEINND